MLSLIENYTGSKRAREASKSFTYDNDISRSQGGSTNRHSINEDEAPLM